MPKRFFVEPRASKAYPWQLVDGIGGRDGVVSIHKTKLQAERARTELKKELRRVAREDEVRIKRLREIGYLER